MGVVDVLYTCNSRGTLFVYYWRVAEIQAVTCSSLLKCVYIPYVSEFLLPIRSIPTYFVDIHVQTT